ncbi:hypothetical protein H8356DRAFT_1423875 [Neocallimastix lanati (nom. inval.)]|nr:hypothetical protein H8356DRAFT_1423875 [Neocallimastix sp. JGI-2020a]
MSMLEKFGRTKDDSELWYCRIYKIVATMTRMSKRKSRGYFGIRLWEEVKHDNRRTIKYSVLDFANAVLHGETFQNHMEAERILKSMRIISKQNLRANISFAQKGNQYQRYIWPVMYDVTSNCSKTGKWKIYLKNAKMQDLFIEFVRFTKISVIKDVPKYNKNVYFSCCCSYQIFGIIWKYIVMTGASISSFYTILHFFALRQQTEFNGMRHLKAYYHFLLLKILFFKTDEKKQSDYIQQTPSPKSSFTPEITTPLNICQINEFLYLTNIFCFSFILHRKRTIIRQSETISTSNIHKRIFPFH